MPLFFTQLTVYVFCQAIVNDSSRSYTDLNHQELNKVWFQSFHPPDLSQIQLSLQLLLSILFMCITGFPFLLPLPSLFLLRFDVFLTGWSHVSQCCYSHPTFQSLSSLCCWANHVCKFQACFLPGGLQYWMTTSYPSLFLFQFEFIDLLFFRTS